MDNLLTEPITLAPDTRRFEANGVWYNVSDKIATGRMAAYQKLTATYGFGLNTQGFFGMLQTLWKYLNERKDADASILVYNALEGISKIRDNQVQAFEVCALFMNADGEDCRTIDQALIDKKIADWSAEGIDSTFFLIHAGACATGYRDVYARLSHTTLPELLNSPS